VKFGEFFWEKGEFSPEIPLRQCHHLAIFHRKKRLHVGCEKYRILLWYLSSFNRVYGIINNFEILISTPKKILEDSKFRTIT
jgi:hypothetical protein